MHREFISPALDRLTKVTGGRIGSELQHIAVRNGLGIAERIPGVTQAIEHYAYKDPRLAVNLAGIELDGVLGVGAGWDKASRAVKALHATGFSFVEIGASLVYDQKGNPTSRKNPRQRYDPEAVALNSLGFNAPGVVVNAHNSERYQNDPNLVIGLNIGKNKTVADNFTPAAYYFVAKRMYEHVDYVVINVSSPNTPGLRALQDKGPLTDIVQATKQAIDEERQAEFEKTGIIRNVPIFIKVAPELSDGDLMDGIYVVRDNGAVGIIASNTTANEEIKAKYGWRGLPGGLSGDDSEYRALVEHQVEFIHREDREMPIISAGAINTAQHALRRVELGATALQIVTGLRSEGLMVASNINRGLIAEMDKKGYETISEARGKAVK